MRTLCLLFSSACFVALAGCANSSALPDNLHAQAAIGAVCRKIMHVEPGEVGFVSCADSLADSAALSVADAANFQHGRDCAQAGVKPGTPAMATCMLDHTNATASADDYRGLADMAQIDRVAAADSSQSSYYSVPQSENHRREQYSCAQLGLTPGSASFNQCVGDLDAAMFAAAHSPS